MKRLDYWLYCLASICIAGCCALECIGPVDRNIKPYLHYWEKPGVTAEQRRQDGEACGGGYREANMPSFSKEHLDEVRRRENVTQEVAYTKLHWQWQRCMLSNGYRYAGNCESEASKKRPACGAP